MAPLTDKRLVDFFVPALLSGAVGALLWLAVSVSDLTGAVREIVVTLTDHSRRLENLETLFLRKTQP